MIGKTLGHYQITEKLGEGGMGVVYKARDLHLDRFVALKILPPEKVADPERKQRFVKEAKAASALNHPNIVHVYDVDQSEGTDFIAMECVEGKTLDQWIGHRGLRLSDALKYAVQVAGALAKAHSAGIIHRDLKPTNIMVNEDGVVKVLDFGLAKLTEWIQVDETASTATVDDEGRPITEEGVIVGTVSYMSPEQAEGKKVDARSDIFSLGSVLYEMVTGKKAFQGTSKLSTLSAILHQEPKPVSRVTPTIPSDLEKLINRCLRKDPAKRWQTMADLKVALDELKEDSDSGALEAAARAKTRPRRRLGWAAGVIVALVIAAAGVWLVRFRQEVPEVPPVVIPLTSYPGSEDSPSLSPDGNQIAFVWDGESQDNFDIYLKQIGVEPPSRLTNDPAWDGSPSWSPDGRFIAFLRVLSAVKRAIMVIPQRGGQERTIAEIALTGREQPLTLGPYLSWTPDSKWLVCPAPVKGERVWALFLFSAETGEQRKLTSPPGEEAGDTAPAVSPDGRSLVYSRVSPDLVNSAIWLLRLGEGYAPSGREEKVQLANMTNIGAAWMPDGREIVFGSGTGSDFGLWRMSLFKGRLLGDSSLQQVVPPHHRFPGRPEA
jgi:serine/threonine protein kinase